MPSNRVEDLICQDCHPPAPHWLHKLLTHARVCACQMWWDNCDALLLSSAHSCKDQVYTLNLTPHELRADAELRSAAVAHHLKKFAGSQDRLPVCLSGRLPFSGEEVPRSTGQPWLHLSIYSEIHTYSLLPERLLSTSCCPLLCTAVPRETNDTTDSEFGISWSNAAPLTSEHPLSKGTTSPEVDRHGAGGCVDGCDLLLCQTSACFHKMRLVTRNKHTQTINKVTEEVIEDVWLTVRQDKHALQRLASYIPPPPRDRIRLQLTDRQTY